MIYAPCSTISCLFAPVNRVPDVHTMALDKAQRRREEDEDDDDDDDDDMELEVAKNVFMYSISANRQHVTHSYQ